ncbi:MAG: phenylacetate-CoA oxygenase subunit PaaC [Geminicoccaceae bacterium]|nr:phenylacetate-CoA oxygenase subunit PaaC [Geminicoccaceae bacterium]MCS7268861.1 phenylacetate-CoA oxygenase subunit PaaC [Geminicoccaceae bacterium]MCX7630386.1 phenylacetate-CoA oxygenase subunit PaaC [Geminicoccaceae bacterium]MDW8125238.1 1,2-phenylacetyl-CoA epoxidase subunit PaaC [Geminicoccaceae bacterium]MDW8341009.1 1,2-phenylacetyl-CoA epoxidase subunit PaaC [Geminicoccaceae bacterium]
MTTIRVEETPHLTAILRLADTALVLSHRLSEWCGHAPMLEEDLALANIALDLLGQARLLYQHAAELEGKGRTEDDYAYLRDAPQFRNYLIAELPRGDFAFTIVRQTLFSAYFHPFWRRAANSTDRTLAAVAAKAEKELAYHLRHAGAWLVRLGDGTEESHRRTREALDALWPYTGEFFEVDAVSRAMIEAGVLPDPEALRPNFEETVDRLLREAGLPRPPAVWMQSGGLRGVHTEHLGHMLAVMQHLQRAYPGARW